MFHLVGINGFGQLPSFRGKVVVRVSELSPLAPLRYFALLTPIYEWDVSCLCSGSDRRSCAHGVLVPATLIAMGDGCMFRQTIAKVDHAEVNANPIRTNSAGSALEQVGLSGLGRLYF